MDPQEPHGPTTPLCRFRVLYLGSEVPTRCKDGLQGVQEPLELLYPEMGAPDLAGIDAFLSIWSNGVLIEPVSTALRNNKNLPKRFYHINALHYCAAVRYCEFDSPPSSIEGLQRFLPLDNPHANESATHHPPLFALVMRRLSGVKLLQCKVFVCKSDAAANELVRACFRAYSDTAFASALHQQPQQFPTVEYQQQQQQFQPMIMQPPTPIYTTNANYAGSAIFMTTPTPQPERSLLLSTVDEESAAKHNRLTVAPAKKKKRSPFWPFIKPAGERRRSHSLNSALQNSIPQRSRLTEQQQPVYFQPQTVMLPQQTTSEYGGYYGGNNVVYYIPQQQQQQHQQRPVILNSFQQHSNKLNDQPLHLIYAAPPPQPQPLQYPYWVAAAAPAVPLVSDNSNIPTSFITESQQPNFAPQQPWAAMPTSGRSNDLLYYDPLAADYYNNNRHQNGRSNRNNNNTDTSMNGYYATPPSVPSKLVQPKKQHQHHQPNQINNNSSHHLRKAKSMARHDVSFGSNTNNNVLRRAGVSPTRQRHRVRSGGYEVNNELSTIPAPFATAAIHKPPLKNGGARPPPLHSMTENTSGVTPKSTTASTFSTSSSSSMTGGGNNSSSSSHNKQSSRINRSLAAHTKTMDIGQEQQQQQQHSAGAIDAVVADERRSSSSAVSSGNEQQQQQHARPSPPPPPPLGLRSRLATTTTTETTAKTIYENHISPRSSPLALLNDEGNNTRRSTAAAAAAAGREQQLALLVDNLRINQSPTQQDGAHWQEIITKTKVVQTKQRQPVNSNNRNESVSPVDSGQHEPPEQQHSLGKKWPRQALNENNDIVVHDDERHLHRHSPPYIPAADYDK